MPSGQEKIALCRVVQQHLLTFEQQWTGEGSGHTLPKFVTDELQGYLDCDIWRRRDRRPFRVTASHPSRSD